MSKINTIKNGKAVLSRGPHGGYVWTSPSGEHFEIFAVANMVGRGSKWMVKGSGRPAQYPDLDMVRASLAHAC